jgi:hypothetical protein
MADIGVLFFIRNDSFDNVDIFVFRTAGNIPLQFFYGQTLRQACEFSIC